MEWATHIQINPLLKEVFNKITPYTVAKKMGKDKSVAARWKEGSVPTRPEDVALLIACALEDGIDVAPFQTFTSLWDLSPSTSYEQKLQRSAPDFSVMAGVQTPNARIRFGQLELDTPIGVASSPMTGDASWTAASLDLGYGLSTFKTRRAGAPVGSWPAPQIAYVCGPLNLHDYDPTLPPQVQVCFSRPGSSDPPIPDIVNSIGVPHEGENSWPAEYEIVARHPRGRFVGISIIGDAFDPAETVAQFERAASIAAALRPPFIELNVSCPNLERPAEQSEDLDRIREVCAKVAPVAHRAGASLFLKLPHMPEGVLRNLLKAVDRVVDVIVLRNTLRVRPVCTDQRGNVYPAFPNRQFGGLSGPSTYETTLRLLRSAASIREDQKHKFLIVAAGGVATAAHAIGLLNNGADLIQTCTGAIFDPLLSWKVRYQYCRSSRKNDVSSGSNEFLQLARNEFETQAFHNLELAVQEYGSRGFAISFTAVREAWHGWLTGRSAEVYGAARRVNGPPSKDQWVRNLSRHAPTRSSLN